MHRRENWNDVTQGFSRLCEVHGTHPLSIKGVRRFATPLEQNKVFGGSGAPKQCENRTSLARCKCLGQWSAQAV